MLKPPQPPRLRSPWLQRKEDKVEICRPVLRHIIHTTAAKHVILRRRKDESGCDEIYKYELLFFIFKCANLWGSCRRACLSFLIFLLQCLNWGGRRNELYQPLKYVYQFQKYLLCLSHFFASAALKRFQFNTSETPVDLTLLIFSRFNKAFDRWPVRLSDLKKMKTGSSYLLFWSHWRHIDRTQFLIDRRNINHKLKVCWIHNSKILKLAFDNPCRPILHWLLTRTSSFLGPSKMTAVEIFCLHFFKEQQLDPVFWDQWSSSLLDSLAHLC